MNIYSETSFYYLKEYEMSTQRITILKKFALYYLNCIYFRITIVYRMDAVVKKVLSCLVCCYFKVANMKCNLLSAQFIAHEHVGINKLGRFCYLPTGEEHAYNLKTPLIQIIVLKDK